jgi:hypothetical protein
MFKLITFFLVAVTFTYISFLNHFVHSARPCYSANTVKCRDGIQCIDKSAVCNGRFDCLDKSDEGDRCLGKKFVQVHTHLLLLP